MKLSGLLLMLAVLQTPLAPRPAAFQGTVVDSVTSQPVVRASVQLRTAGGSGPTHIAYVLSRETGADGSFAFQNVPPGDYAIEVSRSGYITNSYGERRDGPNAGMQTLNPGQSLAGIQIALTPGAVIYGRLMDDRGETVVGATVQAIRTRFRDGLRARVVAQTVISNDLGEYRFYQLPAGEYRIAVTESPNSGRASIPWFFPGMINSAEAQVIDVKVGAVLGGVSFVSVPARKNKVSGIVQGSNGSGASVVLSSRGGDVHLEESVNRDTGEFEFVGVPPGSYTLVARSTDLRASIPLDVRNVDVSNARITLAPGYQVPVRVRIDGHGDGPDPALEELYFVARRETDIPGLAVDTYSPFADGHFIFDLLAGDYRVEVSRPDGAFVKSMKLGEIDVLNQGLQVNASSDVPMEILVGTEQGSVSGRVAGTGSTVVLVPDVARRGQRRLYQSMRPGAAGEFVFQKVPPGDYKVFVWQEENGGPWLDPEYVQRYEDRGAPVRVEAGKSAVLQGVLVAN